MSTLNVGNITDGTNSVATEKLSKGTAVAWISYNGHTNTIRSSYNINSVTDNADGDMTINFATSMSDTNYCVQVTAVDDGSTSSVMSDNFAYGVWVRKTATLLTTTSVRVVTGYPASTVNYDQSHVFVAIFSN